MKKMKKTISVFSIAASGVLLSTPALTACASKLTTRVYHIVSINDIHGAIAGHGESVVDVRNTTPGCLRIAREFNKIKKQYPETLFLSAGDENSGEAWSVCDHGRTTYPVLSSMGIRYAAVGNHAFEWGIDDLASGRYDKLGRTPETQGQYFVCSNILNTPLYQNKQWCLDENNPQFIEDYQTWFNQKVTWADPYKIVNFGPATVCLIGLATQNTLVDGNKPIASCFTFMDYNVSVHYAKYFAKQQIGEQKFNEIDSFILFTHCDSDYENNILSGESVKLAAELDTDVDAIISAHSHKSGCGKIWNNKMDKPICIGQAGTAGQYLLDTQLTIDTKAPAGKRLSDISMEVRKIPVPKNTLEATQEWEELLASTDPNMIPVVNEYEKQKVIVDEKVRERLSEVKIDTSTENDAQPDLDGKPFEGYFNGLIHSGVERGHEYYDCKAILDHMGGWANRASILGFCIDYWDQIVRNELPIPSVSFLTQDSLPSELKNGPITQRHMFALQPYDNYMHLGYITIMQLANILNYSLAGNPKVSPGGTGGFSYTKKNPYQPDLCYFVGYNDAGEQVSYQTAYNILDDNKKPVIQSGYACGVLPFYGVKMKLVEITDDERKLTFTNPVTQTKTNVYDDSAKYRVATKEETIFAGTKYEKKVVLPQLWVYDGHNDGKGIKWGSLDRSDDPKCWISAKEWYELENPTEESKESPRLIPFISNSFNYNGGNTQTKMFKQYCQYSILNYGIEFIGTDTPETIRDFITTFCKYSDPDTREWSEYVIPTNIPWSLIKSLVDKPE